MSEQRKGNAVIGQSGGPTMVINQSLVGVIQEAQKHAHIEKLLGARHGVRGIVDEKFIPLKNAPDELLERVAGTPAAALGSTRDKPDQAEPVTLTAVGTDHVADNPPSAAVDGKLETGWLPVPTVSCVVQ